MQKGIATLVLVLSAIACVTLISGCSSEAPAANHTTPSLPVIPTAVRPNVGSAETVQVHGHVYLDDRPVDGARVLATSYDGADSVSTVTDKSGAYVLHIKPGIWNNITAYYGGLKHTIRPVYLAKPSYMMKDEFDITLTETPSSTIEGSPHSTVFEDEWGGHAIYIEAAPYDGSASVLTSTDDSGRFSMSVKPGIDYYVSGNTYLYASYIVPANFSLRNLPYDYKVRLNPDETVLLDYRAFRPSLRLEPTLVSPTPKPSGKLLDPAYASGHVFLDSKPVKGASVEAASIDGGYRKSAITGDDGSFRFEMVPGLAYRITASYHGQKHTIWPAYNGGDRYEVNLTEASKSMIEGYAEKPCIEIEARPITGGPALTTTNGMNSTYSLEVEPGIEYFMSGWDNYGDRRGYVYFSGPGGYDYIYTFQMPPGNNSLTVRPNETVLLDARISPYPFA